MDLEKEKGIHIKSAYKEDNRRVKIIKVYPEDLFKLFTRSGRPLVVVEGIPEDAEFRGFNQDWSTNTMNIFVEHESFDEIPRGTQCPVVDVTLRSLNTAEEAAAFYPLKPIPLPKDVQL